MYNPYDFYFKKAKQEGYKARSAFKLEEIQEKFFLIKKTTKYVLDIGCAPWSWLQYTIGQLKKFRVENYQVIGLDLKPVELHFPGLKDIDAMRAIDLLEQTYWIYDEFLSDTGVFVIKVFMGPGFEEFVLKLKKRFWGKNIKVFKPISCRSQSKETYIIKQYSPSK